VVQLRWLCGLICTSFIFEALANYRFVSQLIFCRNVVLPLPITEKGFARCGLLQTESGEEDETLAKTFSIF